MGWLTNEQFLKNIEEEKKKDVGVGKFYTYSIYRK